MNHNQAQALTGANIPILHSTTSMPQQQVNLFQPHNLSPHMIKTDKIVEMNNVHQHQQQQQQPQPQHVMMVRSSSYVENNINNHTNNSNEVQMMVRVNQPTGSHTPFGINNLIEVNSKLNKTDEVSDHIDSVINEVVNGYGIIPTNIEDFEEETNSSFNEDRHFFKNESESNINMQQQQQLQQQNSVPVKNTKKKNANKNVSSLRIAY